MYNLKITLSMITKENATVSVMTDNQMMVYAVETYLEENYESLSTS